MWRPEGVCRPPAWPGLGCAVAGLLVTVRVGLAQVPHTAPYGVTDRGQVEGQLVGPHARALPGRTVSISFPKVPGGIGATTAVTDRFGRFSLEVYVYGRGGSVPDPLDSLEAVLQVDPPDGREAPMRSAPLQVRFSPVGRPPVVTCVRVPIDSS
jgi:hypothetical protein